MRRLGFLLAAAGAIGASASPTLKSVVPRGLRVGAALNRAQLDGRDPASVDIATRHFNSLTPENDLKWTSIHQTPDVYDFSAPDRFAAIGERNGMFLVGHVLVWHEQTARWVFAGEDGGPAGRETVLSRMKAHIQTVVGRYRGRIHAWDVVNEALDEDGSLRKTNWLAAIGEDYIEKAFEYAHEADPGAELYYNDYNLWKPAKREGAIALVRRLRAKGLRVDAVGEQGHWGLSEPSIAEIDDTVAALASGTGVKVMLTELDVDVLPRDPDMWTADPARKAAIKAATNLYPDVLPDPQQRQLAARYADIFRVVVKHRALVTRVTFWGVTDAQSWLQDIPIAGRVNYPLLWDRQGRAKPAFDAVVAVLGSNP